MIVYALALAPVLAFGLFIYLMDKYDREPLIWLVIAFLLGIVSIYPAIEAEQFLEASGLGLRMNFGNVAINAFVVVGLSEELSKFILLRLFFYRKRFFTEPMNGIVYSVMLSLGFAAIESVRYMMVSDNIYNTALIRSYSAVPAHFVFAVFMGYFMGQARFTYKRKRFWLVLAGVSLAVIAHGTYDFFLLSYWMPASFGFISFGFLFAFIVAAIMLIERAQKRSPFVRRRKWKKSMELARGQEFKDYLAGQKDLLKKRAEQRKEK